MKRQPGDIVADKYRLERRLGDGGFGEVWLANQLSIERRVAIKFLKSSRDEARQRFAVEVAALARLSHPNCVTVLDSGIGDAGGPYLVTEYVVGETLDRWLQSRPSLTEILSVATQLAEAIAHAHTRGITHRDIKPPNVIVTRDDVRGPHAMLLDFGVAKLSAVRQTDITKTGEIIGTSGFMSPEQLRAGVIGPPTDVYSFGVLLFEMISGRPPYAGATQLELAMEHLTGDVPDLAFPPLHKLVRSMLAKSAERRPTMEVVCRGLHGATAVNAAPHSTLLSSSDQRADRGLEALAGTHGGLKALIAIVGLLACAAGLWVLTRPPAEPIRRVDARIPGTALVRQAPGSATVAATTAAQAVQLDLPGARDAGLPRDVRSPKIAPADGCGRPVEPGVLRLPDEDREPRVVAYVPPSYDGDRKAPLLLLLHDVLQPADDMIKIPDLRALADRDGFVMIAPDDNDTFSTWLSDSDKEYANNAIDRAAHVLCIDTERIYIIGHGNGGFAAQDIACRRDGVIAMAQTSHRFGADAGPPCAPEHGVPTLIVSMRDDPTNPMDDSPDCLNHRRWSLARHEKVFSTMHQCSNSFEEHGPDCQRLKCEVPLTLCRPRGGRDWKTMRLRLVTNNPLACNSPPGDFDFSGEIWRFFKDVGPR